MKRLLAAPGGEEGLKERIGRRRKSSVCDSGKTAIWVL